MILLVSLVLVFEGLSCLVKACSMHGCRKGAADKKFYFIWKLVAQKSWRKLLERIIPALALALKKSAKAGILV